MGYEVLVHIVVSRNVTSTQACRVLAGKYLLLS